MLRVSVLASSSKGNATFVEMDGVRFLIDAGISTKRIVTGLNDLGVEPESLSGVLLTHEHVDHVKALPVLVNRFHLPVYSRAATLAALPEREKLPAECLQLITDKVSFGRVLVETFNISHDAADPVGFRIIGSRRCTFATDLGFVSSSVQEALDAADVLVLETNHEIELLKNGCYPWPTKRRIMSNKGHLSNNDAAWALARLKKPPQAVFLAHLSEENNEPQLAVDTVRKIITDQGGSATETKLILSHPDKMAGLADIQ